VERGVVRNLLGRLNARSSGDIIRIAERWQIPLSGNDARRHVGALYRTMTDIRAARTFYAHLTLEPAALVASLAVASSGLRTLAEIAELVSLPEEATRDAAVWLFYAGVLAREGDRQELPVGATPRLFLPRELEQVFTRVRDEIELGDMRRESLRSLMSILDDGDIEEAARAWGLQVIPGLRSRDQLTEELLRLMDEPGRVKRVSGTLSQDGLALWEAVREASEGDGGMVLPEALAQTGLLPPGSTSSRDAPRAARILQALQDVERRLLIWHSYDNDGRRWLFVPHEVRHPGMRPRTLPLDPLTPVPDDDITADPTCHPHALAWDLLTLMRELASHRSPVWQPGEPLARGWQRQINGQLWFAGEQTPPEGYTGFLLSLALMVGIIEPGTKPARSGADKGSFRPQATEKLRSWRSEWFSEQTAELRRAWRDHDDWIEGRERDEIEVWGAHWPNVRAKLLDALSSLETGTWYRRREVARHLAEQAPGMVGSSFTVASSRGDDDRDGTDGRVGKVAQIIASELETAFRWFGLIESGVTGSGTDRARVIRLTEAGQLAADNFEVVPSDDARLPGSKITDNAPVVTVDDAGMVELLRPAPLHVWSLSAFSDQVALKPDARYELTAPSLGRALGAGFDLDQVVTYLRRQSGQPLSEAVQANFRSWTAGYRRVRLRRMIVVQPDEPALLDEIEAALEGEGFALADRLPDGSGLRVFLLDTGEDGTAAEEQLQRALRANGFSGQWPRASGGGGTGDR